MKYVLVFIFCLSNLWSVSHLAPITLAESPYYLLMLDLQSNQEKDLVLSWIEVPLKGPGVSRKNLCFSKTTSFLDWTPPEVLMSSIYYPTQPNVLIDSQGQVIASWKIREDLFCFKEKSGPQRTRISLEESLFNNLSLVSFLYKDQIQFIGEGEIENSSQRLPYFSSGNLEFTPLLHSDSSEQTVKNTLKMFQNEEHRLLVFQKKDTASFWSFWRRSVEEKSLGCSWYKDGQWSSVQSILEGLSSQTVENLKGSINSKGSAALCWDLVEEVNGEMLNKVQAIIFSEEDVPMPVDLSFLSKNFHEKTLAIDDAGNVLVVIKKKSDQVYAAYKPVNKDWIFLEDPFELLEYFAKIELIPDQDGNFILACSKIGEDITDVCVSIFSTETKRFSELYVIPKNNKGISLQLRPFIIKPGSGGLCYITGMSEKSQSEDSDTDMGKAFIEVAYFTY